MDILAVLQGRLDFMQRFYSAAAEPFETTRRKIEVGQEPYVPRAAPEDYDGGPEYELEWLEADAALRVLGHCSLVLLAKALHDYLREFTMREAGAVRAAELPGILKGRKLDGWFTQYMDFLTRNTPFQWSACPVGCGRIEQINLCRNDIAHDPGIDNVWPQQSKDHFSKYPNSAFADKLDLLLLTGGKGRPRSPVAINVTPGKLMAAIEDVRQFCSFVETQRTRR